MNKTILLAHGSGGKLSHELIAGHIAPALANPIIEKMDDSAVFDLCGRIAFTTDSFVVNPLFFPGGDIGKLAVCGTINDLSVAGARPLYLSLALIIEEGLPLEDLERVMSSVSQTAAAAGVTIVTGDTKVVDHGSLDKLFINTAGLGLVPEGSNISGSNARPGDRIIINGPVGDHGVAVMGQRSNLRFKVPVESDCAPLNSLVEAMMRHQESIHAMRDPTRGGLATTLNEIARQSSVSIRLEEDLIPVRDTVRSACEMLGLDPLYVANEGKLIAVTATEKTDEILRTMRQSPCGEESVVIGEVAAGNPGRVVLKTRLGASRIVDMLSGELLPRIC
ncbi:MAG: hydrogenase expression/formation protein HypE [Dehalococcoidales bacterium]|nr:hydrogenase expression/formation protein HypE [Dehalococcoidales bacterium]